MAWLPLSRDLYDRGAERGEAVQDRNTDLELRHSTVEVPGRDALTQQLHTVHLCFDVAPAVVSAAPTLERAAEVFRRPQRFISRDRACRHGLP